MKSFFNCTYHIIIASSGDKKFLTRVNQDILFNYIRAMLLSKHCTPLAINGHSNHIHIVSEVQPDLAVQRLVKEIQVNTTDFLRREKSVFPEFIGWDLNYLVLSIHKSQAGELKTWLADQFNYHKQVSFNEELQMLEVKAENAMG
ncbi:MAG: transposase [Bacteroidales bacterium]|nr:transposase [Bacteroidales bacterium]